ncbi:hypothetical protein AX17_002687 [Amanita inopinata Kibby_2008]|nr:hypothetical protein AX17_002687 [Amanita inopinata Kibby_2008]
MSTLAISFPAELVEAFISETWSLPLTVDERISLMKILPLVHSVWRTAYIHISSKDVHIPCASYWEHYFSIIRRECRFYDYKTQEHIESLCASITFDIEGPSAPLPTRKTSHSTAKAMSDVLYLISDQDFPALPALRRVSVHYHNMSYDDIFDNYRFVEFPAQVETLEISFSFDQDMPPFLSTALRDRQKRQLYLPWKLPSIKHLTLAGCGSSVIADMVSVCPNLEILELNLENGLKVGVAIPNSTNLLLLHGQATAGKLEPSTNTLALSLPSPRHGPKHNDRWLSIVPDKFYSLVSQGTDTLFIALTYPSC